MEEKKDSGTVAVVIPMHNASRTIRYTIASLRNQTIPPDQIVIVDDASDDASLQIAKSICPEATFVELPENVGAYHATFAGVNAVTCEHVVRCDSDDELTPGFIAKVKELLSLYSYDIISMPQLRTTPQNPVPTDAHLEQPSEYLGVSHCCKAFFDSALPWYVTGKVFRTDFFKGIYCDTIPKKVLLDDVFMTFLLYCVSNSFVYPNTTEGYVYHYQVGYWSEPKDHVSIGWWKDLLTVRVLQCKVCLNALHSLNIEGYDEMLLDSCRPTDLIETLPLLPCKDIGEAASFLNKDYKLTLRD